MKGTKPKRRARTKPSAGHVAEHLVEAAHEIIYETVIDTVGEGITFSDEKGRFEVFNSTMETLTGYTKDEANASADFSKLLYPDSEEHQQALDRLGTLLRTEKIIEAETSIRAKNGTRKTLLVTTTLLTIKGRRMFLSAYRDISDRKAAEERLADANARLSAVLDAATQVAVIGCGLDGKVTVFNKGAELLLGYKAVDVVGTLTIDVFHAGSELKARAVELSRQLGESVHGFEVLVHAARSDGFEERDWTFVRHDGSRVRVNMAYTALRDARSNLVGFLGIGRDVTVQNLAREELQRAKELAEAASEAKTRFLANMSHELRTPLHGIIGTTQLLLVSTLTPEQRDLLETIRLSGDTLLGLISDILDISKIDAGKIELESHPYDLAACVEEVVRLMAPAVLRKGVELVYDIEPGIPDMIQGDKPRLKQVLSHLLSNATKFTEHGEVVLSLQRVGEKEGMTEFLFTVQDTGVGIAAGTLDRLFKPFAQADSSSTRRHGGAGLGLVISSRIVNLMKGRIWIDSRQGQGTKVSFTILARPVSSYESRDESPPALQGTTVMAVARNASLLNQLSKLCVRLGACVDSARSDEEAMSKLEGGTTPGLVLLDENTSSERFLDHLSKLRPSKNFQVILLAANRPEETASSAPPEPFSAVIPKPVGWAKLAETVSTALTEVRPDTTSPTTSELTSEPRKSASILVAEDNLINQKLIVRIIERLGHSVDLATSGKEVLEALTRRSYDLIFMDVQMPEMDGFEATREILKKFHDGARPRIVAMTANAMRGDKQRCLDAGMDDYLSKPVQIEDVEKSIQRWAFRTTESSGRPEPSLAAGEVAPDPDIVARLRLLEQETDRQFLLELIDMYLQDAPGQRDKMVDAKRRNDPRAFSVAAHTLKGSSLNLGAKGFGAFCKSMEELGRLGKIPEDDSYLQMYDAEFERLRRQLLQYKERSKGDHGVTGV